MKVRLALAAIVAALGPAAAAQAATTVGSDLTKAATASACAPASSCTYFTGDATTAAPTGAVPFDGVDDVCDAPLRNLVSAAREQERRHAHESTVAAA